MSMPSCQPRSLKMSSNCVPECYFVVPSKPAGLIRPDTFVMANMMTRGQTVSLPIPALANLFKCMRLVSTFFDPSFCDDVFPFHFLFGWANSHWPSLYSPTIDHRILYDLPTLAKIAGATPCFIPEKLARMYFWYSKEYLCFLKGQMFLGHVSREHDLVLVDMISSEEHALGL
jgi:hypothetical protein